jgi:predicted ATP-grasp superfamily ATP-dependent carboligase
MKIKVAVFPAGTEIGLEINNALKQNKLIDLYGLTSACDHSIMVYENLIQGIPYFEEEDFLLILNEILETNDIDYIYPAHDDVLLFLKQKEKEVKATVISSDLHTVDITRSKLKTYQYFSKEDFIPKLFTNASEVHEFPVFAKPDIGQGSKGIRVINNQKDLLSIISKEEKYVIAELLPGDEYTVDCFTDSKGALLSCIMRTRERIRSGIAVKSKVIEIDEQINNIALIINNKLKFNGAWFFQLKKDIKGNYKLLEIAARIAGTMGLSRNLGINYPLLTLYNHLNIPVSISENKYDIEVDRALISRYKIGITFRTVYVDLDDTLIINNRINTALISLLYQFVNDNKKIVLVTKHDSGNLEQYLKKYKISMDLFDEVILLSKSDSKFKYINDYESIFIDDSYNERLSIKENISIPVFAIDNIESLLDWRW